MTKPLPLDGAIAVCGSAKELARRINVHESTVAKWRVRNGRIPLKHVHKIHVVTGIPLAVLRPDFFAGRGKPNQLR